MKNLIIFAVINLIVGSAVYTLAPKKSRSPASKTFSPRLIGKHQRLIDARISAPAGIPDSDDKDLVLKFSVQGLSPIQGEVHYNWVLPPGASLVSGELSDSVSGLPDPKKVLEREISIQGVSLEDEPKVIVLQVYTEIEGVRIGNAAVFSTKPESVQSESGLFEKSSVKKAPRLPREVQL